MINNQLLPKPGQSNNLIIINKLINEQCQKKEIKEKGKHVIYSLLQFLSSFDKIIYYFFL